MAAQKKTNTPKTSKRVAKKAKTGRVTKKRRAAKAKKKTKKSAAKKKTKRGAKTKSAKADTTAGKLEAFAAAAAAIEEGALAPPAHVKLRPGDIPFWEDVIDARARDTWTRADLVKAAILARTLADIETTQGELNKRSTKTVIPTNNGSEMLNPLLSHLQTLTKRVIDLSRALHIHAAATQGRARDTGEKRKGEKAATAAVKTAVEEPLIAPPIDPAAALH